MSADDLKPAEGPFPRVLTRKELRFEISFALSQVAKSTVWEWARTDQLKKQAARERIIDTVAARFDRLQVRAPAPDENGFRLVCANTAGPGGRSS